MTIEIGQTAPDFTLPTDGGGRLSLTALRGSPVVLYFYPKDDTPGCTKEACAFRDLLPDFSAIDAAIVGLSKDPPKTHDRFKAKYALPFTLASDEAAEVARLYGIWVEKSRYGRTYLGMDRSTFLIDREGVVRAIWRKVKVEGHAEQVLEAVRAL
jgi:thioredoxin-dependent peroxiredoxin